MREGGREGGEGRGGEGRGGEGREGVNESIFHTQSKGHLGVIWGVILDNPVHFRYVQSSGCHVSTDESTR